jgi:large subunit ribosomal protein L23
MIQKTQNRKNEHRLLSILLGPVISEKATMVADKNEQVVFEVARDANKLEIKGAVEMLFKVEVESVQVVNQKGKAKRFGRFEGRRNHVKKAYVSLKPGQEINFESEVK